MAVSVENSREEGLKPNLEVLVGTYEEFVLGFKLQENSEGGLTLAPSFTNHSHCGSIRAVATSKRFLASGSTDESIRLFSLRDRTEHGYLQQHNGTITCLEFYKDSHMFSGSEDGNICVWNTRTWNCDKTLIGHKGGVTAISVHPSGKLALSVGRDRTLKTWNLIKGRTAYVTNIKGVAEAVKWAPDGDHYAVAVNNTVHVYQVQSAGIIYSINFGRSINALTFTKTGNLVVGGEKPEVEIHSILNRDIEMKFTAHDKRIKAMLYVTWGKSDDSYLITASNDGFIKIWNLMDDGTEPSLVTQVDTTCRITSMNAWLGKPLSAQTDVKPLEKSATKSTGELSRTRSAQPKKARQVETFRTTRPLKPAIKRRNQDSEAKIVQCSSGQFIAEPIKKRDEKRPRLTFKESIVESK